MNDAISGTDTDDHSLRPETPRTRMLAHLVTRRSKLTPDEAAMLREVFPRIHRAHRPRVVRQLQRRGLQDQDVADLAQATLLTFYTHALEEGFPDDIAAWLHKVADRQLLNFLRSNRRSPFSAGLPSSGSERPPSGPSPDSKLDAKVLAPWLLAQLSPEHRDVVEAVLVSQLSYREAAELLGIHENAMKSRLVAAKEALARLIQLLPPSQRGPR